MNKTIAIVNDPDVTLGTLPSSIISINAWEADWKTFNLNDNYIIFGNAIMIIHKKCELSPNDRRKLILKTRKML